MADQQVTEQREITLAAKLGSIAKYARDYNLTFVGGIIRNGKPLTYSVGSDDQRQEAILELAAIEADVESAA